MKVSPAPIERSSTVRKTRISPTPVRAAIRAAMWTAMPPM
jgi:hypothetical protein